MGTLLLLVTQIPGWGSQTAFTYPIVCQFHMTESYHWKLTLCFRLFFSLWLKELTHILEKAEMTQQSNANLHPLTSKKNRGTQLLPMLMGICCSGRICLLSLIYYCNYTYDTQEAHASSCFIQEIQCHQKKTHHWVKKYYLIASFQASYACQTKN